MNRPTVSFVVPCYRLAHLLPECVGSILSQTHGDLEVLIMDDCSPDNTAEVARSFEDPRVRHVRNDPNLGHLRNYNKGIELAQGRYVWLISADDYLRRPYVVEKYVGILDRHPDIGYAFCSGVGVRDGVETGLVEWATWGPHDRILNSRTLLRRLLQRNCILAPSGMVRREYYEKHGAFPLDMPWAGDWYLWCLFALFGPAAYFGESMVCYRHHGLSFTTHLTREKSEACREEEISIRWILKQTADAAGLRAAARECDRAIADGYALNMTLEGYQGGSPLMSLEQFEESLRRHVAGERERRRFRALVYAAMASDYRRQGNDSLAREYCDLALRTNPWMTRVLAKRALLSLGRFGHLTWTLSRGLARRLRPR